MLVIGRYRPLYFLQRLFSVCLTLAFFSCATSGKGSTGQAGAGTILFTNQTPFTVHLVRGSGRIDAATVSPNSTVTVSNIAGTEETYYPLFDILLTADYSLPRLRPENPDFYYQVDSKKARQEIEVKLPAGFDDTSAYIVFTSKSKGGGVSLSRNQSSNRMTGINYQESKSVINEGETLVFRENTLELQSLRINPLDIAFGEISYQAGYVYSFFFDGNEVIQTDARPLVDVGKSASVILEFSGYPISLKDKQVITDGLQNALQAWNVPLKPDVNSPFGFLFTIAIDVIQAQPLPPVNTALLQAEVELAFFIDGMFVCRAGHIKITESNESLLFRRIADQLRHEQDFFYSVNTIIKP